MATGGQMSTASDTPSWYKWLILVSACTTQFLRSTFLHGTIPVLSIYYEANFGDRKLSSMIGSTQAAFAYGASENFRMLLLTLTPLIWIKWRSMDFAKKICLLVQLWWHLDMAIKSPSLNYAMKHNRHHWGAIPEIIWRVGVILSTLHIDMISLPFFSQSLLAKSSDASVILYNTLLKSLR